MLKNVEPSEKKKSGAVKRILDFFKRNKKICFTGLSFLVILTFVYFKFYDKPKANVKELNALLVKSSELTTAKLNYKGIEEYKDSGIRFINKSNFTMVYDATVRIGIDIEKVVVTADDKAQKIYIEIPKAEVQDVNIDTSTIKYYDEKFSLFNSDTKEDNNRAIAFAKEHAKENAASMGILEYADEQAEYLIKGILSNAIPTGYKIELKK